jgi:hypothetical protein
VLFFGAQADVQVIGVSLSSYFTQMSQLMTNSTVDWPGLGEQILMELQTEVNMTGLALQAQITNYIGTVTG